VFLFGFATSGKANIGKDDHCDLAGYGVMLMQLADDGIATMLAGGELKEIKP